MRYSKLKNFSESQRDKRSVEYIQREWLRPLELMAVTACGIMGYNVNVR